MLRSLFLPNSLGSIHSVTGIAGRVEALSLSLHDASTHLVASGGTISSFSTIFRSMTVSKGYIYGVRCASQGRSESTDAALVVGEPTSHTSSSTGESSPGPRASKNMDVSTSSTYMGGFEERAARVDNRQGGLPAGVADGHMLVDTLDMVRCFPFWICIASIIRIGALISEAMHPALHCVPLCDASRLKGNGILLLPESYSLCTAAADETIRGPRNVQRSGRSADTDSDRCFVQE